MSPEVVVQWMNEIKGEVSTQVACQWLGIPRSTYYRWRKQLDVQILNPLVAHIRRLCQEHRFRYGYRKITALLRRVMQVADHLLKRDFQANHPLQKLVTDITYCLTAEKCCTYPVSWTYTTARSSPTVLETRKILPWF